MFFNYMAIIILGRFSLLPMLTVRACLFKELSITFNLAGVLDMQDFYCLSLNFPFLSQAWLPVNTHQVLWAEGFGGGGVQWRWTPITIHLIVVAVTQFWFVFFPSQFYQCILGYILCFSMIGEVGWDEYILCWMVMINFSVSPARFSILVWPLGLPQKPTSNVKA